jgi:hypothetical protein
VDRLIHLWIWLTYAVLPLLLHLGLSYLRTKKPAALASYSLVMGVFGMIPHSFIYVALVHGVLALFALATRGRDRPIWHLAGPILAFAFLPLAIYALINLPVLLIPAVSQVTYPYTIDMDMAGYLSNNGELIRALSISNNWWPQIPPDDIGKDLPYRASAIGIIALTVIAAAAACGKPDNDKRWLLALCLLAILGALFLAQGMNNPLIAVFVKALDANGMLQALAPIREWARISIMIPVFLSAAALISLQALPEG